MIVLNVKNVHTALPLGLNLLRQRGVERDSRYGKVLMIDEPVATVYACPTERVLFHPWRDANPFFHFYESLWMLAGRQDVAPLARFAKRMATFSDDGKTFNAAYGHRWRSAAESVLGEVEYGRDQLKVIGDALAKNPDDRRCVLQIWDCDRDLGHTGKDAACNVTASFQVGCDGRLNMTVFCRSNDLVWGCYGANAVHFSMLHEYMAARVNVRVGVYTQISVNLHGYLETAGPLLQHHVAPTDDVPDPYEYEPIYPYPICDGKLDDTWDDDVREFVTDDGRGPPEGTSFKNRFFAEVAWPIVHAHDQYKDGRFDEALKHIGYCEADDWRLACTEWLERRQARKRKAEDDGAHGADA